MVYTIPICMSCKKALENVKRRKVRMDKTRGIFLMGSSSWAMSPMSANLHLLLLLSSATAESSGRQILYKVSEYNWIFCSFSRNSSFQLFFARHSPAFSLSTIIIPLPFCYTLCKYFSFFFFYIDESNQFKITQ